MSFLYTFPFLFSFFSYIYLGRFLNRCITFCILWQFTTYLYVLSLRVLLATDVMALFATNVAVAYLLSWVILHEQFVGVRVRLTYFYIFHKIFYLIQYEYNIKKCETFQSFVK